MRRLLLGAVVIVAVSYGSFVLFATQFGSPTTGPSTPLAGSFGKASSLYWLWLQDVPGGGSVRSAAHATFGADLWTALAHTLALVGAASLIVLTASLVIGTLAAARAGTRLDFGLRSASYLAWAVPAFLLALILQAVFRWLSERGFEPFALQSWPGSCLGAGGIFISECKPTHGTADYAFQLARHLFLPALALAVAFIGLHSRYLRSALLVALHEPYTTTARAKGLSERRVVLRHALRTSLATFASVFLLDFGAIFGAALAVDWVFGLNGLGGLFLYEIATPVINPYAVQLLLTITAALVVAAALLSELAVLWLDPRARTQ